MTRITTKIFENGNYDLIKMDTYVKKQGIRSSGIYGLLGNKCIRVTCPDGNFNWAIQFKYSLPYMYRLFEMRRHPELHSMLIDSMRARYTGNQMYSEYEPPKPTSKLIETWPIITHPFIELIPPVREFPLLKDDPIQTELVDLLKELPTGSSEGNFQKGGVLKVYVSSQEWVRFNQWIETTLFEHLERLPDLELHHNFEHFKRRVIGMKYSDANELAQSVYGFKTDIKTTSYLKSRPVQLGLVSFCLDGEIVTSVVYG